MSEAEQDKWTVGTILLRVGIAIFVVSLCLGMVRSFLRDRSLPKVGAEYVTELRLAFQQYGYDRTLPWMRSAVLIDIDNDTTARELLTAARQADDLDTAVATLESLVRLDPEDAEIRTELVSALLAQGRIVEALAHGRAAIRLDPGSSTAYSNLGAALLGLESKREAAACFRRALQLDPHNENARRALDFPLKGF